MQIYKYPQTDLNQQNLDWIVNAVKDLQEKVATGSAGIAVITSAADMTDPNMIYIYRGSEAGYNYDHWYYWDTGITSFVDGGAWGMDMSMLPLSIENGGTGSESASDARTALGITPANIGAVAASDLPLSISNGGTGEITAANARVALGINPANIGAVAIADLPLAIASGGTGAITAPAAAGALAVPSMAESPIYVQSGEDVDGIVVPGSYSVHDGTVAASLSHWPSSTAGVLRVFNAVGDNREYGDTWLYLIQEVTDAHGQSWRRTGSSGSGTTVTWGDWVALLGAHTFTTNEDSLKLPDGTMLQWGYAGTYSGTSTGETVVAFPQAFYDTNYAVTFATRLAGTDWSNYDTIVYSYQRTSISQMTVHQKAVSGTMIREFTWIAIGRWR